MSRNFRQLLEGKWEEKKFLSVGLDSDWDKIPESARADGVHETLFNFNRAIVDATKDIAGSYKINSAFYESHGERGWGALQETIEHIHEVAPDTAVILDAKRADIGNTNNGYVAAAFENLNADAITVHPYLGAEALQPFLDQKDKGIIVLCRTSNPGSGELQDLEVNGEPLYLHVARSVKEKWDMNSNCALVVGATYPEELRKVREIVGDMPILIPGIGAQGGDLEKCIECGKDSRGRGMIIAVSRAVIFASNGPDYAEAAAARAQELHDAIVKAI